jgi:hypothetical protein
MIAGRRSKTIAFVAILALLTFGALATASAQPADIIAVNKAFQDHYARGNYPTAQIDAQELERLVKARFGAGLFREMPPSLPPPAFCEWRHGLLTRSRRSRVWLCDFAKEKAPDRTTGAEVEGERRLAANLSLCLMTGE